LVEQEQRANDRVSGPDLVIDVWDAAFTTRGLCRARVAPSPNANARLMRATSNE
jgi:hypothetical protein